MSDYQITQGDVLEVLAGMADDSFDAVFCDPPYGLSFMGKEWDHGVPSANVWREVLRVLKPGANLMAFGGTRTYHRLAVAIEDAGFEIRDCFSWLYGSGFPKAQDIGKAIDKKLGAEREVVGQGISGATAGMQAIGPSGIKGGDFNITAPATPLAKKFDGYKSALKPAWEPIVVAMAPKAGSFADNAIEHGVAGLDIDGARIATEEELGRRVTTYDGISYNPIKEDGYIDNSGDKGRYPANLILDKSAGAMLDAQAGEPVSRYFYCAKASREERELGLSSGDDGRANLHPCVKPLDLCRYFTAMMLPPRRDDPRRLLVPFSGSGSEMIGAMLAGWDFVQGVEIDPDYVDIARARADHWTRQQSLGLF